MILHSRVRDGMFAGLIVRWILSRHNRRVLLLSEHSFNCEDGGSGNAVSYGSTV